MAGSPTSVRIAPEILSQYTSYVLGSLEANRDHAAAIVVNGSRSRLEVLVLFAPVGVFLTTPQLIVPALFPIESGLSTFVAGMDAHGLGQSFQPVVVAIHTLHGIDTILGRVGLLDVFGLAVWALVLARTKLAHLFDVDRNRSLVFHYHKSSDVRMPPMIFPFLS